MKKLNKKRGVTLIEAMLYFVIVGAFLLAITLFSLQILDAYRLSENFHDIQASSSLSLQRITDAIHRADDINETNSVFDNDDGVLALTLDTEVSFYLDDGDLYMKEGVAEAIQLNPDSVTVTQLRFRQITSAKTPDQVVIDGQFESVATAAGLQHSFPFHLSASLRKL